MTLSDLFTMLAEGELQNLSLVGNGTVITPQQPKIVRYANEALLELYSRFVLKENDLLLELYNYITFYHLLPRFSLSYTPTSVSDDEPIRYILDKAAEPFNQELLKVLTVYDNFGRLLPLNDDEKRGSVFTPQVEVLQVPNPVIGIFLSVRYQQRHAKLSGDLGQDIFCPDVLLVALTSYIAYKVFSHMNTTVSTAKAQEFLAFYETVCAKITDRDLVNSSISQSNTRFARGGWR